tara:strand:- start:20 stop:232 length:213 start_codon:yes stop_codon:yes gene_type:complete
MRLQLTADDIINLIEAQMPEIKIDRDMEYPQFEYTQYGRTTGKKSKTMQQHGEADFSFLISFQIEEYNND